MLIAVYRTASLASGRPTLLVNARRDIRTLPDHPAGDAWTFAGTWDEGDLRLELAEHHRVELVERGFAVI